MSMHKCRLARERDRQVVRDTLQLMNRQQGGSPSPPRMMELRMAPPTEERDDGGWAAAPGENFRSINIRQKQFSRVI